MSYHYRRLKRNIAHKLLRRLFQDYKDNPANDGNLRFVKLTDLHTRNNIQPETWDSCIDDLIDRDFILTNREEYPNLPIRFDSAYITKKGINA